MAERRRRRRLSDSEDGSDNESVSSHGSQDGENRSDCESETGYGHTGRDEDEDEHSEYESAEDNRSQGGDREHSDGESDPGKVEERTRGDGQEAKQVDCDADQLNPQYIPRRGPYFEHDVRYTDDKDERSTRPKSKKKLWKEEDKWNHDMYREEDQAPKSREEIVMIYGFDVRSGEHGHMYSQRPYRGRGSRGSNRGGRRPQYRDRRNVYNERNFNQYRGDDHAKPPRNEEGYEEQNYERQHKSPRNTYQNERRNDNHYGNQQGNARYQRQHSTPQYRDRDLRGSNEQLQTQKHSQSYIDKPPSQYTRSREWTNTNYRKHQQEQIIHDLEERNTRNANNPRTNNTLRGRESKSYSKERRRQPPARMSSADQDDFNQSIDCTDHLKLQREVVNHLKQQREGANHSAQRRDNGDHVTQSEVTNQHSRNAPLSPGLEGQVEKLTIKVDTSQGQGDSQITRTVSNEKAMSPVSSNVRQVRQDRPTQAKPSPAQQRGRPKRYSSQRQRQMPEPAPPPAMHPPPLMDGPGFYDPGFQGPVYHPSTTPPARLEGTPPPPQGPPPPPGPPQGPPPHTGQPAPPPSIRPGIMVQPDISLHPGIQQHPSQPHIQGNIYTHATMPTHPPPRPPPPQAGTYPPAFVSPGVVNYSVPPGPPYQLAAPVPVPVSASIPASIPAAGPAPTPTPVPIQQFPVTSQPQGQTYGGITYYSPEQQQFSMKRTPPRRPVNPIRIEPPPEPQRQELKRHPEETAQSELHEHTELTEPEQSEYDDKQEQISAHEEPAGSYEQEEQSDDHQQSPQQPEDDHQPSPQQPEDTEDTTHELNTVSAEGIEDNTELKQADSGVTETSTESKQNVNDEENTSQTQEESPVPNEPTAEETVTIETVASEPQPHLQEEPASQLSVDESQFVELTDKQT